MPVIKKKTLAPPAKKTVAKVGGVKKPVKRSMPAKDYMEPDGRLARGLEQLASLRDTKDKLAGEIEKIQQECIGWMKEAGIVAMPGYGSLVQGETMVLDDAAFIEELREIDPDVAQQVIKEVVDKAMVEALVKRHAIDAKVVLRHSEMKPIKPYIRIDSKKKKGATE